MPFYQSRLKEGHFLTFEKAPTDGRGFSLFFRLFRIFLNDTSGLAS